MFCNVVFDIVYEPILLSFSLSIFYKEWTTALKFAEVKATENVVENSEIESVLPKRSELYWESGRDKDYRPDYKAVADLLKEHTGQESTSLRSHHVRVLRLLWLLECHFMLLRCSTT